MTSENKVILLVRQKHFNLVFDYPKLLKIKNIY